VRVHHAGADSADQRSELPKYLLIPQSSLGKLEWMELPDRCIVSGELKHFMTMRLQEARFRLINPVLSTLVLIVVVDLQNPHMP
jgi:hypothetical protein